MVVDQTEQQPKAVETPVPKPKANQQPVAQTTTKADEAKVKPAVKKEEPPEEPPAKRARSAVSVMLDYPKERETVKEVAGNTFGFSNLFGGTVNAGWIPTDSFDGGLPLEFIHRQFTKNLHEVGEQYLGLKRLPIPLQCHTCNINLELRSIAQTVAYQVSEKTTCYICGFGFQGADPDHETGEDFNLEPAYMMVCPGNIYKKTCSAICLNCEASLREFVSYKPEKVIIRAFLERWKNKEQLAALPLL